MFSLLPETEKNIILREYSMRRWIVFLLFLFVSGLIATISIFPSRMLSTSKIAAVKKQITIIKNSAILKEAENLNARLSQTNLKLKALSVSTETTAISTLLDNVIKKKGANNTLVGFSYKKGTDKAPGLLILSGIARDRESLLSFVKELKTDQLFTKVDLPVSNFTKEKDVPFSIELSGKF